LWGEIFGEKMEKLLFSKNFTRLPIDAALPYDGMGCPNERCYNNL